MSMLHVFVAHTGARLDADAASFASLEAFKQWLAEATQVPPPEQILLTPKSKHVKFNTLLTEREFYLFDQALFSTSTPNVTVPPDPIPPPFAPDEPPDTISNEKNLKAWQNLFQHRRDWATHITEACKSMSQTAESYMSAQENLTRAIRIATANHEAIVRGHIQKHTEAKTWLENLTREQDTHSRSWESVVNSLGLIPAKPQFHAFLASSGAIVKKSHRKQSDSGNLAQFVDDDKIRKAMVASRQSSERFSNRIADIGTLIDQVSGEYVNLLAEVDGDSSSSRTNDDPEEPSKLQSEIEMVMSKIQSDYQHVLGLIALPQSVAQASKMALLHTRNFLPSILDMAHEMSDLERRSVEQRNAAIGKSLSRMQTIASIESVLMKVRKEIDSLEMPDAELEAYDQLALPFRLPKAYGSLLVEAVRRQEWVEKMKRDSSALAEEIAGYQEEEQRRRKKWVKSVNDVVRAENAESKTLGVEINLQGEDQIWPDVTRADLEDYLKILRATEGMDIVVDELSQMIKEIDRPTRQQVKRVKAFKAGSVHEAGFGRGSLMLRGEDEMKVLREVNSKLEEELRGQKSRVRKLEDLVHRQSHIGRLIPGQIGEPTTPTGMPSPSVNDDLSRRSSFSSRRFSSHQATDEKVMARRIVQLEAELMNEKTLRAAMEKDASTKADGDAENRRQIEEANSTKKDLMENMEAQQREFADERRALNDELRQCKMKLEEVEDELDRILGSRDNERTGTDDKMHSLVAEIDQIRAEAAEEVQKALDQVNETQSALDAQRQIEADKMVAVAGLFSHLSADQTPPEDHSELITQLEDLTRRSAEQVRDLEQAVASVKAENTTLQSTLDQKDNDIVSATSNLQEKETEITKLQENIDVEQAKISAINAELEEERGHLASLRAKFADGETGSETLRRRIAEEESKVGTLSTELAEAKSHINGLDVALSASQRQAETLQSYVDAGASRVQERSSQAKYLSERLFTHIERLSRMLESHGFIVSYPDDTMTLQRASKANASTVLIMGESTTQGDRRTSTPSPAPGKRLSEGNIDLTLLQWIDLEDGEDKSKRYDEFRATIDRFDIHVFSDAVTKRMRDIEHTARKWQREARNYRDKAHRANSDAHEKIAFRSFKEGDLALFLPTRNQVTRPWAAFNIGAPHYFLRETDAHRLHNKEWLVARISKVEERIVDLSKAIDSKAGDGRSIGETESGISFDDDNPFDLSDGLRWYLLDAAEEKPGAPTTPGLGKSTVASAHVAARGSVGVGLGGKKTSSGDASKTLNKSLESRRSSANSKKSLMAPTSAVQRNGSAEHSPADSPRPRPAQVSSTAEPTAAGTRGDEDQDGRNQFATPIKPSPSKSRSKIGLSPSAGAPPPEDYFRNAS
ncbi:putative autophagy-related protein 11, partial [Aulographum hederae CBS 113979]